MQANTVWQSKRIELMCTNEFAFRSLGGMIPPIPHLTVSRSLLSFQINPQYEKTDSSLKLNNTIMQTTDGQMPTYWC
jgi:hypothetical protein